MSEQDLGRTPKNPNLSEEAVERNAGGDQRTPEQIKLDYPALISALSLGYKFLDDLDALKWRHLPRRGTTKENPEERQKRVWKRLKENMQIDLNEEPQTEVTADYEDPNITPLKPLR